ncbi:TPA: IS66 family transposase zinc-finger binding domain-containing protein, partial [Enterococcus faecium]
METTDTLLQLLQEAHKTNQAQQQTIQNLTTEIQLLNEKVNYLTNKLFGRSKETLFEETNGQLNLFSDEEISVSVPEAAATIIPVKGHQRVVGTKADKIKHLPITEKEHLLPLEEQFCEHCGSQMKDIGRTKVREEIRFHQAMLDCLTHYQHTYCCKSCEKE